MSDVRINEKGISKKADAIIRFRSWSTVVLGGTAKETPSDAGKKELDNGIRREWSPPGIECRRRSRTDREDEREIRYVHISRGSS